MTSWAQDSESKISNRQFGIEIGVGSSFLLPLNEQYSNSGDGLSINPISLSYTVKHGIGISFKWLLGGHNFKSTISRNDGGVLFTDEADFEFEYSIVMVGPIYSIKISDKSFVDFSIQGGRFHATEKISSNLLKGNFERSSLGYSCSMNYRKLISSKTYIRGAVHYLSGKNPSIFSNSERITPLIFNAGVGIIF
jgi:hypothetical protein